MACPQHDQLMSVVLALVKSNATYLEEFTECSELLSTFYITSTHLNRTVIRTCTESLELFKSPGLCSATLGTMAQNVLGLNAFPSEGELLTMVRVEPTYNWAFYLPLLLASVVMIYAWVDNLLRRNALNFQSLSMVIMGSLWALILVNYLGVLYPMSMPGFEVFYSLLEGYLAYCFGAWMIGHAKESGGTNALIEALHKAEPATLLSCFKKCECCRKKGPRFRNGHDALKHWKLSVVQFSFIKSLMFLCEASMKYASGLSELRDMLVLLFGLINTVSTIVMLRGLLNLWRPLSKAGLLEGARIVSKFVVIKLAFSCIVFNSVVLAALVSAGIVVPPLWMCQVETPLLYPSGSVPGTVNEGTCAENLFSFVLMCEATILLALAAFYAFSASVHRPCPSSQTALPVLAADAQPASSFSLSQFLRGIVRNIDCRHFWHVERDLVTFPLSEDEAFKEETRMRWKKLSARVERWKLAIYVMGFLGAALLTLGTLSPDWFYTEIDGCQIHISYVTSTWCSGSCPSEALDQVTAVSSSANMRDSIIYGVCNAALKSTPAWAIIGTLASVFSLAIAVAGLLFKLRMSMIFAAIFGIVGAILMIIYGPANFNSQQAIISLQKSFGLPPLAPGFSLVFMFVGAFLCAATALFVHRLKRNKFKLSQEQIAPQNSKSTTFSSGSEEPADSNQSVEQPQSQPANV